MEHLPHIDDHSRTVEAPPERTWSAMLAVMAGLIARPLPRALVSAWGLDPSQQRGDWSSPVPGDTLPGFAVAEMEPCRLLVLRGRHRFSRYELRFTIAEAGSGRVEVRARSSGEFPGSLGAIYRSFVLGSRGHVLGVRRLLARIAERAEREDRG